MSEPVFAATYRNDNGEEVRVIAPGGEAGAPPTHTIESGLRSGWSGVYSGGRWRPLDDPDLNHPDVDWGPWMIHKAGLDSK